MGKMDKYLIIIVTYNRKMLLEECVTNALGQTIPADKIVIVNNASTDGTQEYLQTDFFKNDKFRIIHCKENIGGAGGFYRGMKAALNYDVDWLLVIDDDAILETDYTEKIFAVLQDQKDYRAAAGIVMTDGYIDKHHRRNLSKYGMILKTINDKFYKKTSFACDIASFCGMMIRTELVKKIGLPHAEYFIFHDDTEYSLRILKYSKFLVVSDAILNHKTKIAVEKNPRRYTWKDYYEIRNKIFYIKEHGNIFDIVINSLEIFTHKVFRNCLFAIIKRDDYDWKYEKETTYKAIRDGIKGKKYIEVEKR